MSRGVGPVTSVRDLFTGVHAVDLVLAIVVVEVAYLAWRGRRRPGVAIDLVLAFAPGVCLMLALRAALAGAGWPWVAAFLAASLPFHLADVDRRKF